MGVSEQHEQRKIKIMEKCYDCYCENGIASTGLKALAKACDMTTGNMYVYFDSIDDLIIQSTAYCMAKVEDEFMALSPKDPADIKRFVEEVPYWTAKKHGKKYRFMYQVYASPKYREQGKEFFRGVNVRYHQYAVLLSGKLGLPADFIQGMTYMFVRACVHYALFEDEDYLQLQLDAIRASLQAVIGIRKQIKEEAR